MKHVKVLSTNKPIAAEQVAASAVAVLHGSLDRAG